MNSLVLEKMNPIGIAQHPVKNRCKVSFSSARQKKVSKGDLIDVRAKRGILKNDRSVAIAGLRGLEKLRGTCSLSQALYWWKTVDQAMENPEQIVAQVMNMGDWNDVCRLVDYVGDEGLCRVIKQAEIGMFNEHSWHYWHYRLGLAKVGSVPTLPTRKLSYD